MQLDQRGLVSSVGGSGCGSGGRCVRLSRGLLCADGGLVGLVGDARGDGVDGGRHSWLVAGNRRQTGRVRQLARSRIKLDLQRNGFHLIACMAERLLIKN